MLIIQRITTHWTRDSRGGAAAVRRNAVPHALRLPPAPSAAGTIWLHDIRCRESAKFVREETLEALDDATVLRLEPMSLYPSANAIRVHF